MRRRTLSAAPSCRFPPLCAPPACPVASHLPMRPLSLSRDAHTTTNELPSMRLLPGQTQPLQRSRNRCSHVVPIDASLALSLSAWSSSTSSSSPRIRCHLLVPARCKARETVASTIYSPSQSVSASAADFALLIDVRLVASSNGTPVTA